MHFASIRELNRFPSRYVHMVSNGECVIITPNGKPTAVLSPLDEEDLEDFILAKNLDLEGEFQKANKGYQRGETRSAEELLVQIESKVDRAV